MVLQEISGHGRTCTGLTSLYSSQFGQADDDADDAEEAIKEMDDKDNGEDDEEEEDVMAVFESQYCSQHGLQNTWPHFAATAALGLDKQIGQTNRAISALDFRSSTLNASFHKTSAGEASL